MYVPSAFEPSRRCRLTAALVYIENAIKSCQRVVVNGWCERSPYIILFSIPSNVISTNFSCKTRWKGSSSTIYRRSRNTFFKSARWNFSVCVRKTKRDTLNQKKHTHTHTQIGTHSVRYLWKDFCLFVLFFRAFCAIAAYIARSPFCE